MIKLVFADLRQRAGMWIWTLAVAVTCAAGFSAELRVLHGSLASARRLDDTEMIEGAQTMAGWILTAIVLTGIPVLVGTIQNVMAQRQRDLGLWKTLGMRPARVSAIVVGQLAVVGCAGAILGHLLSAPVARIVLSWLLSEQVALPGTQPAGQPADLVLTLIAIVLACVLGGLIPVWRVARRPEVELLHATEVLKARCRCPGAVMRFLLAGACGAGVVVAIVITPSSQDNAINQTVGAMFGIMFCGILLTPWLSPLIERALGVLARRSTSWFVASRNAVVGAQRSSSIVRPFVIAIGLTGTLFSMRAFQGSDVTVTGFLALFGIPLAIAWVGGVGTIAISASTRQKDAALMLAAGAQRYQIRAIGAFEGLIHALAATVIGVAITAGCLGAGSLILSSSSAFGSVAFKPGMSIDNGPWIPVAVCCGATVVVVCAAVVLSALDLRNSITAIRAQD